MMPYNLILILIPLPSSAWAILNLYNLFLLSVCPSRYNASGIIRNDCGNALGMPVTIVLGLLYRARILSAKMPMSFFCAGFIIKL
jgi:hypothetical protein